MAPSSPDAPTRSRGRPVEIDKEQVARVALDLFEARSYDSVSAAEIAEAAGISRRSLFRYFPTKADLVWDRFAESIDVLASSLAADQGDPVSAVIDAMVKVAEATPIVDVTRARLRIIAGNPELAAFGMTKLGVQAEVMIGYLAEHGLSPLQALVVGNAVTAASYSGYLHWALASQDEHPAGTVRNALGALMEIATP